MDFGIRERGKRERGIQRVIYILLPHVSWVKTMSKFYKVTIEVFVEHLNKEWKASANVAMHLQNVFRRFRFVNVEEIKESEF